MNNLNEIKTIDEITYPMYLNYVENTMANGTKAFKSQWLLLAGALGFVATGLLTWAFGLYPLIAGILISFMLTGCGIWTLPSKQNGINRATEKLMRKYAKTKRFKIEQLQYEIELLREKAADESEYLDVRNNYIYTIWDKQEQLQNLGVQVALDKLIKSPKEIAKAEQEAAVKATIENGGLQVEDAVSGKQIDAQTVPTGLIKEMLAAGKKVTISFGEQIEKAEQSENVVEENAKTL